MSGRIRSKAVTGAIMQAAASFLKRESAGFSSEVDVVSELRHIGARINMSKPSRPSGPYCVRMLRPKQCGSEMVSMAAGDLY